MKSRLVITGMGAITPLGNNVADYWNTLLKGVSGIGAITRFDASRLPVRIAAEVKNFNGEEILSRPVVKSTALFLQYALAAAEEAISDANLSNTPFSGSTGICMGTAMAGMDMIGQAACSYQDSKTGRISPHLVPGAIANMASAHLAIKHGINGSGFTLSTACSAGSDAVITAAMLILAGEVERVIVMGGESILSPPIVSSLAQAKALSRNNESPQSASRPFDMERDGFVIGEGGAAIVLESEAIALQRGVHIHGELKGWGNSLDSWHITAPDPTGMGAALCMNKALEKARIKPENIDYINAHGTSTRLGDLVETVAMKKVFGKNVPPVSSTKGATGHLMGAGGIAELIACLKSIEHNIAPPTLNLHTRDPECDLNYIPNKAKSMRINAAMSNAFGFGGQNSSLIVTRYAPQENI